MIVDWRANYGTAMWLLTRVFLLKLHSTYITQLSLFYHSYFGEYDYYFGKSKKEDGNEKIEEDLIHLPWWPLCSSRDPVHLRTNYTLTVLFISSSSLYSILCFIYSGKAFLYLPLILSFSKKKKEGKISVLLHKTNSSFW